jgi:hypothetical protein
MFITHYFYCPFCKEENYLTIDVPDRGEYQRKYGSEVTFTCKNCHKKDKISVNKVFAKPKKRTLIIIALASVVLFIIGIFAFLIIYSRFSYFFFGVLCLPILFYTYFNSISSNFNKYRIK